MALKSKYSFLKRFDFGTLYNTFLGLNSREQMFALIGAGVVILLVFGMPLFLASSKLSALESELVEGREKQREISRRMEQFQSQSQKLKGIETKIAKGFDATITTTMATLAEKVGIKDRIENIRDKGARSTELFDEISVEVKLVKITVPQWMDYLYQIEQHPDLVIKINQIRIKRRFDNKQLLDVTFEASTFRLQQA